MICVTAVWMGKIRFGNSVSKSFWYSFPIYTSCTRYIRLSLMGVIQWGYKSATSSKVCPLSQVVEAGYTARNWCVSQNGNPQKYPCHKRIGTFLTKLLLCLQNISRSALDHRGFENLPFLNHWNPKSSGMGILQLGTPEFDPEDASKCFTQWAHCAFLGIFMFLLWDGILACFYLLLPSFIPF